MSSSCGKIHLIIGPMRSGKTSELLRRKRRSEYANKKCLLIKYYKDTRYDPVIGSTERIVTHDLVSDEAIVSTGNSLRQTLMSVKDLSTYRCLYIDEIQFYDDAAEVCDDLANRGYDVTVSGLQGDFQRKIFKSVSDLIPLCEDVVQLTAIDPVTGNEAPFTYRISSEKEQEVIGNTDKYIAVDRAHYLQLTQVQPPVQQPVQPPVEPPVPQKVGSGEKNLPSSLP